MSRDTVQVSSKAQVYGWSGSKDGLFDAVFSRHLHRIVDAVPFTPCDLPAYAVGLYDSYLTDPELVRLASRHRLERGEAEHDRRREVLRGVVSRALVPPARPRRP